MLENRYDFKKDLLKIHKSNRRDFSCISKNNEFEIQDDFKLILVNGYDDIVYTAVKDFEDYLFVSMNISSEMAKIADKNAIFISYNKEIGSASGYMGYRITVCPDKVTLEGYDSRGIAQGLYYLEDLMNIKKAPIFELGVIERKAIFSPRITQSPFGMFEYTDECLSLIAHYGYDAIDVWIKDLNLTLRNDYIDLPALCERAERYGIDVYIELYASHSVHPDDEGAEEFYDNLYGKILSACPKIKGFTIEGESSEFHSKDPKVGKAPRFANFIDNIPTGKCTPGWWPCSDYPQLIDLLKKVTRKYNPNIDILFCTYNWGYAPLENRENLINSLPKDITVLATWDMFEQIKMGNSIQDIVDYSLMFEGPGKYFVSEAMCAKKNNLNVYAISNTSGRTWDFGTVPYEPFPFQWIKRYENIVKASEELNLKGLMENIHYAFQPSIISDLQKQAFFTNCKPLEEVLKDLICRDYGRENYQKVKMALELWSEGITHYPPTNEDQYGAFRIGPAYPLWLIDPKSGLTPFPNAGKKPDEFNAMFGNEIYFSVYTPDIAGRNSLPGVRIFDEINEIKILNELMLKGINILEKIEDKNIELEKLCNLGNFIQKHCITVINVKNLYILLQKLSIIGDRNKADKLLNQIEKLLIAERQNVLDCIPIVKKDSRLGYEPSMEYVCDEKALEWKLRQLEHELNITLPKMRISNELNRNI